MSVTCEIKLDKTRIIAGEPVTGEVHYTFQSPQKIRNIIALIYGRAAKIQNFETSESHGNLYNTVPITRSNETVFFDQSTLFGIYEEERNENDEEISFSAGTHTFPIRCEIPSNAPSSFCLEYGIISYSIDYSIQIYRYSQVKNLDAKIPFDVITPIYLNLIPEAQEPLIIEKNSVHFCCCLPTGYVTINANLPKKGFLAGSLIELNMECSNQTFYGIDMLKVYLCVQVMHFITENSGNLADRTFNRNTIVKMEKIDVGSIQSKETRKFQRILRIPPIQPWTSKGCNIFDIKYYLKFKAVFPFPLPSLTEKIPIIIGSVDGENQPSRRLIYLRNLNDANKDRLTQTIREWNAQNI